MTNKNFLIDVDNANNPIINKNTKISEILKIKDIRKFVISVSEKDKFN